MRKTLAFLGVAVLSAAALPSLAQAANISTEIQLPSTMTANLKTDFYVLADNLPRSTSNLRSKIVIESAGLQDVAMLEYRSGSQWVNSPLMAVGNSVVSTSNFVSRNANYRLTLNTPKSYVVGYVLENTSRNSVLASSAAVTTVPGAVLAATSSKFIFNNNLSQGMNNNDVLELQKRLASLGLLAATPNGNFGPMTFAAVQRYQASNGLPSTGWVGPMTRAKLNQ